VSGVGVSYRQQLNAIGISSIAELAAAKPESLHVIKGVKGAKATAWTRQARIQSAGKVEILKAWKPPAADFEISYDIEDYTLQDSVYLHGFLVREAGAKRFGMTGFDPAAYGVYTPVCLEVDETEEVLWRRFLEQLERFEARGGYTVYVYSHYEATQLQKLEAKFGGSASLNAFRAKFVDLHAELKAAVALPTESYSLKTVARYVGFSWRDAEPGGAESMAWWANYLKAPTANLSSRQRVLDYNEDDTRASLAIRDWLERTAR
jgi:uncharacterized protein